MTRTIRLGLAITALAVLALGNVASTAAGGPKVLDTQLVGIPTAGLSLDGLAGGGVAWVLDQGHARLFADGRLKVEFEGLVLATNHTNPIRNGRAVVTCDHAFAAQSQVVPFSADGNAEVDARVSLPSSCLAPTVFFVGVTPTGAQPWFAVNGF